MAPKTTKKTPTAPGKKHHVVAAPYPYPDQTALDAAVPEWAKRINALPFDDFMVLFTGASNAPATKGLAPSPDITGASQFRNFKAQDVIWTGKFDFTKKEKWNEVSPVAAARSGGTITAGSLWDYADSAHQALWKSLSPDERQKEILIASACPGVSRHHWGSEVDFYGTDTQTWATTWNTLFVAMYNNGLAARHGFIWTFDKPFGYGTRYRDERWHWSYYPASKPMLDRVRKESPAAILAALQALWGTVTGAAPLRSELCRAGIFPVIS